MDGQWKEIRPGRGAMAKTVCFIAGHALRDTVTFGGRWTRECQRCLRRWERWLAPYSRGVKY